MEAAAQLMRLDIAGLDFISPDIRQSWRDNQGTILEINAQPQLGKTTGPHLYTQILKQLIRGQGRIPIIVLCGSLQKTQSFSQKMRQILASHFGTIGVASCQGTEVNGEKIVGPLALYTSGTQLLLRKDMEVLIYCITTEEEITLHGLAFDRYNSLFVLDDAFLKWQQLAIDTLLKACLGKVYVSETTLAWELSAQRETMILSKDPAEDLQTWMTELQSTCR
jgi:cyanophycin synthetase